MVHKMTVIHDPISKSALLEFGDQIVTLAGPFQTRGAAMVAAELYCKERCPHRAVTIPPSIPD